MVLDTLRTLAGIKQFPCRFKSLPSAGIHGAPLQDHLVLVGGPYSNAVTAEILKQLPIQIVFCAAGDIRAIYDGVDKKLYESDLKTSGGVSEGVDFGIIVRARNPFNPEKEVLILAGRYGFGSYAAAKAVCSSSLLQAISNQCSSPFEAIVRAQVIRGWPQVVEIIICRSVSLSSSSSFELSRQAAEGALRKILAARGYPKQPGMTEIVWLGRGGQGAKSLAMVLARAALNKGLFAQAFPEYGPERAGAPVKVYNRIAREEIRLSCGIYEPDVLVVLDPTLLTSSVAGILANLQPNGILVASSDALPQEIRQQTGHPGKVVTVDGRSIAREASISFEAIPVLGALLRVVDLISLDQVKIELEQFLMSLPGHQKMADLYCMALEWGYERALIS